MLALISSGWSLVSSGWLWLGSILFFLSWALAGLCLTNNFLAVSVCALAGIYLAVVGSRALAGLWLGSGLALMGSGWAPAGLGQRNPR